MDEQNYRWLLGACPEPRKGQISRLGAWAPELDWTDIPDPYYGTLAGFEQVLSRLHDSIDGFLVHAVNELISTQG
jgi:protein-tyrosine-phosphatase